MMDDGSDAETLAAVLIKVDYGLSRDKVVRGIFT